MNAPRIEISIDGITYENTFQDDIRIDRTNLEQELATHAEKYHYYASLAQIASFKAASKKFELEQLYARVDCEKRIQASTSGVKHTEKMFESEVITDPRYATAQGEYLQSTLLANQLTECAKSMAHRRDMLIQLGGITKQTLQPQRVVEQQANAVREMITTSRNLQNRAQLPVQTPPPELPSIPEQPVVAQEPIISVNPELGIPPIQEVSAQNTAGPRRRRRSFVEGT